MELFISKLVNGIIQVLLFSIIPFLWWLVTARKKENFLHWIGLKKTESDKGFIGAFSLVSLAFLVLSIGILFLVQDVETATSDFDGAGISALPAALIYAFLTTSLSEEILFRGFLLKRLSDGLGFMVGNIIQATIFGLLHGVMFFAVIDIPKAIIIIIFTGLIGWCMGYVNEKKAHGSILPSCLIHGIANLFSSLIAMFAIF